MRISKRTKCLPFRNNVKKKAPWSHWAHQHHPCGLLSHTLPPCLHIVIAAALKADSHHLWCAISAPCFKIKNVNSSLLLQELWLPAAMLPLHNGSWLLSFWSRSPNKPFLLQVALVMVFYHSNRIESNSNFNTREWDISGTCLTILDIRGFFGKLSVVVLEKQLNSVGAWKISLRAQNIAEALLSEPQRRSMVVAGLKANHSFDNKCGCFLPYPKNLSGAITVSIWLTSLVEFSVQPNIDYVVWLLAISVM